MKTNYALFPAKGRMGPGSTQAQFIGVDRAGNLSMRFARKVSQLWLETSEPVLLTGQSLVARTCTPSNIIGSWKSNYGGTVLRADCLPCRDLWFFGAIRPDLIDQLFEEPDCIFAGALAHLSYHAQVRQAALAG